MLEAGRPFLLQDDHFEVYSHAFAAKIKKLLGIFRHLLVKRTGYIKDHMGPVRADLSHLREHLLKEAHQLLEIYPLQDTNAAGAGIIHPGPVAI